VKEKLDTILGELSKLGVHDLREIARSYGIFAPTLLKREELLERIADKMCGKENPNKGKLPTKRGRPPKTKFISKIRIDVPSKLAFMSDAIFSNDCFQTLPDFEAALFFKEDNGTSTKSAIVQGILQSVDNGENNYFFAINKLTKKFEAVVFVPKIFVTEYSLKYGDKIKGSCVESDNSTSMMLTSILQVNEMEPKLNSERTIHGFEDGKFPVEQIAIDEFKPLQGERILVLAKNKKNIFQNAINIAEKIASKVDKVILVGVELTQEMFSIAKNAKNIDILISEYGDPLSVSCNRILASIDYAQALLSEGKNVALISYDLMNQTKILDTKLGQFEKENVYGFREKTVLQIKKIFSIAKATENNDGSITSIAICDESEKNNSFIENNFVSVASQIINL